VVDKNEIELVVERRVDSIWCADEEKRITVWRRTHDRFGPNVRSSTRPILNDEWLAEPLRQPRIDQTSDNVLRATSGRAHDDAHRPRRIGLRPRDAKRSREHGSTRCQTQKLSAGKSHVVLLRNALDNDPRSENVLIANHT